MAAWLPEVSQQSLEETKGVIIEKVQDQLRHGKDATGGLIGDRKPYQSSAYAFYKANKNSLPGLGNPDLIDTGAFIQGLKIDVTPRSFMTNSTDSKNDELQKKYSEGVLKMDAESKAEYIKESLRPVYVRKIKNALDL